MNAGRPARNRLRAAGGAGARGQQERRARRRAGRDARGAPRRRGDRPLLAGGERRSRVAVLQQGIRSAVRKSEARYVPIHLRNTLQSTGQWGAVRVVPGGASWAELLVTGTIEKSNGKDLQIGVWLGTLRAASGWSALQAERRPLRLRQGPAARRARPVPGPLQPHRQRPGARRDRRKPEELAESATWRRCASPPNVARPLRGLPGDRGKGRSSVLRLPAEGDPMMARIGASASATTCSWTRSTSTTPTSTPAWTGPTTTGGPTATRSR